MENLDLIITLPVRLIFATSFLTFQAAVC